MSGACSYVTAKGRPCRGRAREGRDWCPLHDPALRDRVEAGRKLGGHNRRRPTTPADDLAVDFSTVEGVRRVLEAAASDAADLDPSAQRCRVLVAAAEAAGRLLQAQDLEARLNDLEAAIEAQLPGARFRR